MSHWCPRSVSLINQPISPRHRNKPSKITFQGVISNQPPKTSRFEFKVKHKIRLNPKPNEYVLGSHDLGGVRLLEGWLIKLCYNLGVYHSLHLPWSLLYIGLGESNVDFLDYGSLQNIEQSRFWCIGQPPMIGSRTNWCHVTLVVSWSLRVPRKLRYDRSLYKSVCPSTCVSTFYWRHSSRVSRKGEAILVKTYDHKTL